MPEVGGEFDRTVLDDDHYYPRGEIVWLRDALPPNKGHRLQADPNGDHMVLEHVRLTNAPKFFRVRLRRLR
jgi:hypothetical protein